MTLIEILSYVTYGTHLSIQAGPAELVDVFWEYEPGDSEIQLVIPYFERIVDHMTSGYYHGNGKRGVDRPALCWRGSSLMIELK